MRLHRLTITAFGPFPETVEVDFDALSEAGLFLLTGATGAGKSSVLDAVCFALYGEVPGDRHDAKHLRSDHAAPDAVPQVRLEFSVGERRFQFLRSPAWERPKRRGTGTTRQQARVVIEERRDGEWVPLTTRLDDAGLLVTELLGMTCTQFTQVAMLPQGRFQAFLRASSSERHAVLQRLFRTDRFERIERWLAERRRELRRREQELHDGVVTLAHRFSEAAGVPLPDEVVESDFAGGSIDGLGSWLVRSLDEARRAEAAAAADADTAAVLRAGAARIHQLTVITAQRQAQAARARDTLAGLDGTETEHRERCERVRAHHRAAGLSTQIHRLTTAAADVAQHHTALTAALAFPGAPDGEAGSIARALDAAIREEQQATADLHLDSDLAAAEELVEDLTTAHAEATARAGVLTERVAAAAVAIADLTSAVASSQSAAARLESLRHAHEVAAQGLEAAHAQITARSVLAAAEAEARSCLEEAQELRTAHLDAREARIGAMAGELAGQLASGCACPVCGSIDHPHPAAGSGDVGRQQEEAALHAWETAEAQRLAAHEVVLGARAKYDRAVEVSAGRTVEEWAADERGCSQALAAAEAAAQILSTRRAELEELRARHTEQGRELAGAQATLAQLEERLARAQGQARTSRVARDEARGDFPDLNGRRDHHQQRVRILGAAREAVTALAVARATLGEAEEGALRGATEAGFDSIEAVSLALLEPEALAAAEAEIAIREDARRGAEAVLASAEVQRALAEEPADVPATQEALTAAEAEHARAHTQLDARRAVRARLEQLLAETTAALAAWRPLRADFDVADSLSTLAEGTSRENALRIRLSAYVLGERLRQVVDAANERLAVMTDQRYALEHTDERGVGAQKGGLSLRVRDDWTGVRRDPATLSGGETFVVSLALALGLADTVAHESGGVAIETLFIDEGFGTLDTETLDGVMDTLDGLRHNGRVIGVVSHVPELRERIPVGIEVEKARTGSRLAMR